MPTVAVRETEIVNSTTPKCVMIKLIKMHGQYVKGGLNLLALIDKTLITPPGFESWTSKSEEKCR